MNLDLGSANDLFVYLSVYAGVVLVAFWVAMIMWAYRDMRSRSRDGLAQILVAVVVALLNLPGLLIYLFLRPRETLSEAYERSLEEEALLQEIEEKPTCPTCRQRIEADWQLCPNCHTVLKRACVRCSRLLELTWEICPFCATPQAQTSGRTAGDYASYDYARSSQVSAPVERYAPRYNHTNTEDQIEFIDGED